MLSSRALEWHRLARENIRDKTTACKDVLATVFSPNDGCADFRVVVVVVLTKEYVLSTIRLGSTGLAMAQSLRLSMQLGRLFLVTKKNANVCVSHLRQISSTFCRPT